MEDQVYVTKGGESFLEFIGFFEENVKRLGYLRILIQEVLKTMGSEEENLLFQFNVHTFFYKPLYG